MTKEFDIERFLTQESCEPFSFQRAFDLADFAVNSNVSAKLESVVSPVVVLDGTAAVTMASQRPVITSDALKTIQDGGPIPSIGVSRKAINAINVDDDVEIIDPPLLPKAIGASSLLEIIGDGGMGFERDTPASHLVTQAAITLVPKTMMTDLSVKHCGNWFGQAKFPSSKHRTVKTKNGSELDVKVWQTSLRALQHGQQIYSLKSFDFEGHDQVKLGLTSYLAGEFLLGVIDLGLTKNMKMKLATESSVQLDFSVRETPIPLEDESITVKGWEVKAKSHDMTSATIEFFEGLQVDVKLDLTGNKKVLTRAKFPEFKQKTWESAIYSGGDDIIKMMYAANRCLMKDMMKAAVGKYLDENRSTLIVSWRNPGAALTSDLGYTSEGSVSILESVAAGFEKSYDTLTEELAEEMEVDIREVHKAVAVISHRTKDAIGSNAYSAFNDIVIIGEPFKPSTSVDIDKSWQGNQLTQKNDMLAALLQSIGRGVIRQGSASSPRLQNVFLYDMDESVVLDIYDYFEQVTQVVTGYESVSKRYDKILRQLLDYLMNRLKEANDDFVMAIRFLTSFADARIMSEVCVHISDIEQFDGYDIEGMSERLRVHVPLFPKVTVTDEPILKNVSLEGRDDKLEAVWNSIVLHSVTKQLWTNRHIREAFKTIAELKLSLMGIEDGNI